MLLVSAEDTFPESQRSGWSSRDTLEATRIWYAVWRALDSRQLRPGAGAPRPMGSVKVFTRNAPTVAGLPADPAGAREAPTSRTVQAATAATTVVKAPRANTPSPPCCSSLFDATSSTSDSTTSGRNEFYRPVEAFASGIDRARPRD